MNYKLKDRVGIDFNECVEGKRMDFEKPVIVDLLWVRPNLVGGTEVHVRSLLDSFIALPSEEYPFSFVLLVSEDNAYSFKHYYDDCRFVELVAPIESKIILKRILWQIFFQNSFLKKRNYYKVFSNVYQRPFTNCGLEYINCVADIQAYYYPHYHPLYENVYSRLAWIADKYLSSKVITTTECVKQDLINIYKYNENKMVVIPIGIGTNFDKSEWNIVKERYGIEEENYYYTVAQIIPHKNLPTLIKVMGEIKSNGIKLPSKLLISGMNQAAMTSSKEIGRLIDEYDLKLDVVLTGFISNEDRNCLYAHCKAFLFPSVFEGFGIPPIEAMCCGARVITTQCTSIPEVTQGKAEYVDNPYSVEEWIDVMSAECDRSIELDMLKYDPHRVAIMTLNVIFNR